MCMINNEKICLGFFSGFAIITMMTNNIFVYMALHKYGSISGGQISRTSITKPKDRYICNCNRYCCIISLNYGLLVAQITIFCDISINIHELMSISTIYMGHQIFTGSLGIPDSKVRV